MQPTKPLEVPMFAEAFNNQIFYHVDEDDDNDDDDNDDDDDDDDACQGLQQCNCHCEDNEDNDNTRDDNFFGYFFFFLHKSLL